MCIDPLLTSLSEPFNEEHADEHLTAKPSLLFNGTITATRFPPTLEGTMHHFPMVPWGTLSMRLFLLIYVSFG